MFARKAFTSLALVLSLAVAPVVVAHAADEAKAPQSAQVQAELAKLKKMVGAGEISSKEYKERKEALLNGKK
ncbi:MAG: hypothetical protein JNM81_13525 [Rhodospirillaceae bacterium]|nr:hypothetical protein [Rhodospirillaceae bacterium]